MAKGDPKRGAKRGKRLQFMLSLEELAAVDDFRFKHRIPSRAAAVRVMFQLGMSKGFAIAEPRKKSRDYGVLDTLKKPKG